MKPYGIPERKPSITVHKLYRILAVNPESLSPPVSTLKPFCCRLASTSKNAR